MARWLAFCACSALAVLLAGAVFPHGTARAELAYVVAFSAVSIQICGAASLRAQAFGSPGWERALWAVLVLALLAVDGAPALAPCAALATLLLLILGSSLGASLGRRIAVSGHVLAVALISALVDAWSVLDPRGPSAQVAEAVLAEPARVSALVLSFPAIGATTPMPLFGVGDVFFAGLYAAALHKHGVSPSRTRRALFFGLIAGMLATLVVARALPLLPFLGAAVLCTDRRLSSLDARDRRTVLLGVGLLGMWVAYRLAR
jgi:hypothetical protein